MTIALAIAAILLSACAEPQFSNPYDEKSKNYISKGDSSSGASSSSSANSVAYEGETYPTVVIGTQTWFAKNLNYEPGGACYNNDTANCTKYGRMYNWDAAMTACPSGWRLPSKEEWDALINYIESNEHCSSCAARYLKAKSGWNNYENNNGNGVDSYGFAALPGGGTLLSANNFKYIDESGQWWSLSEYDDTNYNGYDYSLEMAAGSNTASWHGTPKQFLCSVRCIKD